MSYCGARQLGAIESRGRGRAVCAAVHHDAVRARCRASGQGGAVASAAARLHRATLARGLKPPFACAVPYSWSNRRAQLPCSTFKHSATTFRTRSKVTWCVRRPQLRPGQLAMFLQAALPNDLRTQLQTAFLRQHQAQQEAAAQAQREAEAKQSKSSKGLKPAATKTSSASNSSASAASAPASGEPESIKLGIDFTKFKR